MKTALQQLIDHLKDEEGFINEDDSREDKYFQVGIRNALIAANSLLETEKQQIIDAAKHGANWDNSPFEGAVQYYDHTYKNY